MTATTAEVADETPTTVGYRSPAVCKAAAITYRQLDYWTTTGLIAPSVQGAGGSGSQRLYSADDVLRVALVRTVLRSGLSLQAARWMLGCPFDLDAKQARWAALDGLTHITVDLDGLRARVNDRLNRLAAMPVDRALPDPLFALAALEEERP